MFAHKKVSISIYIFSKELRKNRNEELIITLYMIRKYNNSISIDKKREGKKIIIHSLQMTKFGEYIKFFI
jgi:hypothetical protein